MPRQNRVTPFGEIVAVPDRGTFMGNRGRLHDEHGRVRRAWQVERWLVCVLQFRGRQRRVMRPGYYTELFFLDEATALAAGHRPCFECRRERHHAFREAFTSIWTDGEPPHSVGEIDHQLHAERVAADGSKRTHAADLCDLPDGTFLLLPGKEPTPFLVLGNHLLSWSAGGYTARLNRPRKAEVEVLTPELTVLALRGGYAPILHPSAHSWA
jgi:hypothetical protein